MKSNKITLKYRTTSGFSLVELSVVLVVIGLLIGAVTGGTHLMKAAKINKVITEIQGYASAIEEFRIKYNGWPGDISNATSYWGTYALGTNDEGVANGNGNELLDTTSEYLNAWKHLARANLITGHYTGIDAGTPDYQANVNLPSSIIDKTAFYFISRNSGLFGNDGNAMSLRKSDGAASGNYGIVYPKDAYTIDKKIDDGIPSSGNIISIRGLNYAVGQCTSADWTAGSATYVATDNVPSCRLIIYLQKR